MASAAAGFHHAAEKALPGHCPPLPCDERAGGGANGLAELHEVVAGCVDCMSWKTSGTTAHQDRGAALSWRCLQLPCSPKLAETHVADVAAGLQQRVYANVEFIGDVSLRAPSAPPTRHYTAQPRLRFFAYDGHDGTPGNVAKGMSIARAVARHISTGAAEAWRRGTTPLQVLSLT